MRKDAAENRLLIEQKAAELFEAEGVENVSMNQISKSLNIGMGTLYRHFTDKSALCFQLISNDFVTLFQTFDEIAATDLSTKEKLSQFLDIFLQFKQTHQSLLLCIEDSNKKVDFKASDAYQKLFTYFSALLNGSSEWRTFKTDMLLNSLTTDSYNYQTQHRKLTNEQLKHYFIQLYFEEESL